MEIKEWTELFLNYRKAMGLIKKFSKKDYGFEAFYKNSSKRFYTLDILNKLQLERIENGSSIITLNKKDNLDSLIKNWKSFADKDLIVYFVNTKTNEKWSVNTKAHSLVIESSNLNKSLKSLFKTIPEE